MNSTQPITLEVGQLLGRFELLLPIARGGMAQVWAARPPGARGFRKIVAIKTLYSGASDMRLADMLLEEAKLASLIVHPNVVSTYELGEEEGLLYLVMEWVDGLPMSELLKAENAGKLPIDVAVQLLAQVCKGLHAAHELRDEADQSLGLVHRDISPQNIIIERRGVAKIVDFGVAKATERDSGLTEDGELKGKIAYMAPEQISGGRVDARTDIFALATLFYLVTTGTHPFRGQTLAETVRKIGSGQRPELPSSFVEGFPKKLETILMKGLSPAAEDRFSTAQELLLALENAHPEWTHRAMEKKVAAYLESSVGGTLRSRRDKLNRAHEELDLTGPRSGTMRAITVANLAAGDSVESTSSRLLELEAISEIQMQRRFPFKSVAIGIGVLCAVVLAQLAYLNSNSGGQSPIASPAASTLELDGAEPVPVSETAELSAKGPPNEELVAPRATDPSSEVQVPSHSEVTAAVVPPKKTSSPKKSPAIGRAVKAPMSPTTSTTPTSRVDTKETEKTSNPAPEKSRALDAWDPAAFGDRH